MIVLIIYGLGTLSMLVVPPTPGIRESAGHYIAIGVVFLLVAATVWRLWLRPAGSDSAIADPRLREPPRYDGVKEALKLLEDELVPTQNSTDLLQWAWLIRLDLAFRQHLWVRIATLLGSILALFLVVPLILALLYGAGVLR